MTDLSSYPVRLAEDITGLLRTLDDHLAQASPQIAAQILGKILDPDNGVLTGVTELMETGSRFARDNVHRGALPPEVWLAMGRAANELHDVGTDLSDHTDALRQFAKPPAPASTAPPKPVASAMVVRRSR
ncbi:hypothetical protein [Streptomyces finlayi]|uniref:Uncharacterized protein n=1 Tax=Streptomyces finlayi TaxID=67296 RepID=A0A7G7BGT8_9ACTN|nr:hypothetical protein [Streptomyces finlayi]QNE74553.1 hypothetical protein F0344_07960 [Streptomyces finlayi]